MQVTTQVPRDLEQHHDVLSQDMRKLGKGKRKDILLVFFLFDPPLKQPVPWCSFYQKGSGDVACFLSYLHIGSVFPKPATGSDP